MKNHIWATLGAASFLAWPMAATVCAQEFGMCADIADDMVRLSCFDKAAHASREAKPSELSLPGGAEWKIVETASPLDDSKIVRAGIPARTVDFTGVGNTTAVLVMSCQERKTNVYFVLDTLIMDDTVDVTYRIGKGKPISVRWDRSTNFKAVGLWSSKPAIQFLKGLPDNQSLFVRVKSRDTLDATFELGNVSSATSRLREACAW